ncbi:unnamed protein product [Rotaria sp. Silwood2]|nr:unnamed protein product [Rotaria sp. Silwood2]
MHYDNKFEGYTNCAVAQATSLCTDNKTADHLWKLSAEAYAFFYLLSKYYVFNECNADAQGVPYNGTCTFTHDCVGWRDGRVICDTTNRCTCRPVLTDAYGKVFWNSTSRRCVYCPSRWFFQGTRCYYFPYEKTSWSNARERCRYPFMADLIVFNDVDDLNWLRKHGEEMDMSMVFPDTWDTPYYTRFWIGAMNEPFVKCKLVININLKTK